MTLASSPASPYIFSQATRLSGCVERLSFKQYTANGRIPETAVYSDASNFVSRRLVNVRINVTLSAAHLGSRVTI